MDISWKVKGLKYHLCQRGASLNLMAVPQGVGYRFSNFVKGEKPVFVCLTRTVLNECKNTANKIAKSSLVLRF